MNINKMLHAAYEDGEIEMIPWANLLMLFVYCCMCFWLCPLCQKGEVMKLLVCR